MENFDAALFARALGLALALEGILWAGFPKGMLKALDELKERPDLARALGFVALGLGVVICFWAS